MNTMSAVKPHASGANMPNAHTKLPHLTDNECSLLHKHQGCMKSHRGYQNHHTSDCPFDFPDPCNYKELMEEILLGYKCGGTSAGKTVGVMTSTSHVNDVEESELSLVGAVMPSTVLGADSESEEDVSAPLTIAHLQWLCSLLGPAFNEPLTVTSMLDCGAHVVLIDSTLVSLLGLHCFCLHKPLPISMALNNTLTSDSHLYEYVKLSPVTPDLSYVSCSIKAIITPGLCVPLLLGLPFLTVNNIGTNFAARIAIDKSCDYDLINLPVVVKRKKLIKPSVTLIEVKSNKQKMLQELVLVCKEHLKSGKGVPEVIKPLNVAAMIKDHIEVLAQKEKFGSLEKDFLSEFKDIFEPLPHVDKLLPNLTAQIRLKDVEQTIKMHTYAYPCKFCKAWQTLIQQHLDSGHIHLSSSPHALPAFIILKADVSVLPCWVNDY